MKECCIKQTQKQDKIFIYGELSVSMSISFSQKFTYELKSLSRPYTLKEAILNKKLNLLSDWNLDNSIFCGQVVMYTLQPFRLLVDDTPMKNVPYNHEPLYIIPSESFFVTILSLTISTYGHSYITPVICSRRNKCNSFIAWYSFISHQL